MVADNNLDYFAVQDINEMEAGLSENSDDKLLVYVDRGRNGNPSHPYLMEIVRDTSDLIVSKILLTYQEHNATDKVIFEEVLNDAFNYFSDENFTSKGWFFGHMEISTQSLASNIREISMWHMLWSTPLNFMVTLITRGSAPLISTTLQSVVMYIKILRSIQIWIPKEHQP